VSDDERKKFLIGMVTVDHSTSEKKLVMFPLISSYFSYQNKMNKM
jgi:hypothetical protein